MGGGMPLVGGIYERDTGACSDFTNITLVFAILVVNIDTTEVNSLF